MNASASATTWILAPEQLVAACEVTRIGALPYSRFVGPEIEQPDHVRSTGRRSLVAARLATEQGASIVVEAALAETLVALMGEAHDAFGSFALPTGARWAFTVTDEVAVTIVETDAGAELRREPVEDAVRRLDAEVARSMAEAAERFDPTLPPERDPERRAVLEARRWRSLATGGHVRRSDATVVARAAAAAQSAGVWEVGRLVLIPPTGDGRLGGFTGEVLGWTFDERGGIIIEPDVDGFDESGEAVVVREDPDLADTLEQLWAPLLRAGSSMAASEALAPRV